MNKIKNKHGQQRAKLDLQFKFIASHLPVCRSSSSSSSFHFKIPTTIQISSNNSNNKIEYK